MTYEQLANYPIGKVLYHQEESQILNLLYHNERDLKYYRTNYKILSIDTKNQICTCKCTIVRFHYIVEGYLYDGEEWYPAYDTLDGWLPYDEEKLEELEKLSREQNEVNK